MEEGENRVSKADNQDESGDIWKRSLSDLELELEPEPDKLGIQEEMVERVMKWLELEIASTSTSSSSLFLQATEFVTINGNEETCGSSFSGTASTVMASNVKQIIPFGNKCEAINVAINVKHRLVDPLSLELEQRSQDTSISPFGNKCEANNSTDDSSNKSEIHSNNLSEQREFDFLMDLLGNILQQIVKNNPNEGIWGIYARWHKIKGNLAMCSEALLKQLRSLQGSELWHDENKFEIFAHVSHQLCNIICLEISSSSGNGRELSAARMHLKIKHFKTGDFTETAEFKALSSSLDEIERRFDASST